MTSALWFLIGFFSALVILGVAAWLSAKDDWDEEQGDGP